MRQSNTNVGWVSDSVTQQIQEQSPAYSETLMSGYAALTRPELDILSKGWIITNLGSLLEFKYGKALPAQTRDGDGFPVYGSNGIIGMHTKALVNSEGIIIGRKGSYGEAYYSDGPFSPIGTTYFIDEFFSQPIRYWFYQLKHLPLTEFSRATAIPGLNREDAYSPGVPLPPLAEQQQIAAKLDELLAQADTIKTRIDTIPKILKRFRQSVLAAAVSGKLTEEWKGSNNASEWEDIKLEDVLGRDTERPVW